MTSLTTTSGTGHTGTNPRNSAIRQFGQQRTCSASYRDTSDTESVSYTARTNCVCSDASGLSGKCNFDYLYTSTYAEYPCKRPVGRMHVHGFVSHTHMNHWSSWYYYLLPLYIRMGGFDWYYQMFQHQVSLMIALPPHYRPSTSCALPFHSLRAPTRHVTLPSKSVEGGKYTYAAGTALRYRMIRYVTESGGPLPIADRGPSASQPIIS